MAEAMCDCPTPWAMADAIAKALLVLAQKAPDFETARRLARLAVMVKAVGEDMRPDDPDEFAKEVAEALGMNPVAIKYMLAIV